MSDIQLLKRKTANFLSTPLNWRNVVKDGVTNFGHVLSLVLFREEQFQVELVSFLDSNFKVPVHRHPNVDSIELSLAGNGYAFIEDKAVFTTEEKSDWLKGILPAKFTILTHNMWHNGYTVTPSCLLSFQLWLNGVKPKNSIGLDWEGEYSGTVHESLVQQSVESKV